MLLVSSLIHQSVSQSVRSGAAGSGRHVTLLSEEGKGEEKKVHRVVVNLRILTEKVANT